MKGLHILPKFEQAIPILGMSTTAAIAFLPYAASNVQIYLLRPEIKSYRRENQDENQAVDYK